MRVSFNQSDSPNIKDKNGFGYAAKMCKESLDRLGHEVSWRDPSADVEINFIQPQHWHWSGVDYRIGYVPWESTELPPGWVGAMNEVDELWTPSPVIAQWFQDAGVNVPIKVYQHGVEDLWSPVQRSLRGRFQTFHHGAEGLRKGSDIAMAAHQRVLWEEYAGITFKCTVNNFSIRGSHRMTVVPGVMPLKELVKLYQSVNLMIYPSWGEGFGLTPLQAMATGMPVLITRGWAPYEHLLGEHNLIDSDLVPVPEGWERWHPGKMFKPRLSDAVDKLKYQWDNRERLAVEAYELSAQVHSDYDWDKLTSKAFSHLI